MKCIYQKFMEGLEYYSTLKDGYPEVDDLAPTPNHIEMAMLGISKFYDYDIKEPLPMILCDGTIGAFWRDFDVFHVSIDFEPDGEFPWVLLIGDKTISGIWNLNDPIPEEIIAILALTRF